MSHKKVCDRCGAVSEGTDIDWSIWTKKANLGMSFTLDFCDKCTRVLKLVYKNPITDDRITRNDPLLRERNR